jgi:gamma-glutamyltranspeptidase/glutathione hydrolase
MARDAGLKRRADALYRGGIAEDRRLHGGRRCGLLSAEDLAGYHSPVDPAERRRFGDLEVFTCGAWCQGPVLLQTLALLEGTDVKALGHNSADYVHHLTEALKLAFSDREAYYTDPAIGQVPLPTLISSEYAAERRKLIDPQKAWPEMPPRRARARGAPARRPPNRTPEPDNSMLRCRPLG